MTKEFWIFDADENETFNTLEKKFKFKILPVGNELFKLCVCVDGFKFCGVDLSPPEILNATDEQSDDLQAFNPFFGQIKTRE